MILVPFFSFLHENRFETQLRDGVELGKTLTVSAKRLFTPAFGRRLSCTWPQGLSVLDMSQGPVWLNRYSSNRRRNDRRIRKAGQCMDVPPGLVHQMDALEDAELFEFSTQHFNSDSHRLEKGD
jgi:hypothetical protein